MVQNFSQIFVPVAQVCTALNKFFPGSKLENLFDELSRTNDALRKLKGTKFERFDSINLMRNGPKTHSHFESD